MKMKTGARSAGAYGDHAGPMIALDTASGRSALCTAKRGPFIQTDSRARTSPKERPRHTAHKLETAGPPRWLGG